MGWPLGWRDKYHGEAGGEGVEVGVGEVGRDDGGRGRSNGTEAGGRGGDEAEVRVSKGGRG